MLAIGGGRGIGHARCVSTSSVKLCQSSADICTPMDSRHFAMTGNEYSPFRIACFEIKFMNFGVVRFSRCRQLLAASQCNIM